MLNSKSTTLFEFILFFVSTNIVRQFKESNELDNMPVLAYLLFFKDLSTHISNLNHLKHFSIFPLRPKYLHMLLGFSFHCSFQTIVFYIYILLIIMLLTISILMPCVYSIILYYLIC